MAKPKHLGTYVKSGQPPRTAWTPADVVKAKFDGFVLAPEPPAADAADTSSKTTKKTAGKATTTRAADSGGDGDVAGDTGKSK